MSKWFIYKGTKEPRQLAESELKAPPPWRQFDGVIRKERTLEFDKKTKERGETFEPGDMEKEMVNAALYLRRPLLVTGKPGTGKSSLAYSVAYELSLGRVLYWSITTKTTVKDGLYHYDALGRLQELQTLEKEKAISGRLRKPPKFNPEMIGTYIRLGPLGTALLPSKLPRVLLIDEIDKSDIDLPNDLLNIFEEGEFEIPELSRMKEKCNQVPVLPHDGDERVIIYDGKIRCHAFPFIVMTSNAERELPAPFMRRCLRLDIPEPNDEKLARIVWAKFGESNKAEKNDRTDLIKKFLERREEGTLATDQLLNAIYLTRQGVAVESGISEDRKSLMDALFRYLDR